MFKTVLRFCAAAFLCLLLVYAPDLFQTARSSYSLSIPERVLLRIGLFTSDSEATRAFDDALPIYIKTNPSVHIRVLRSIDTLFPSSDGMLPDLLLLSPDQFDTVATNLADVFSLPLPSGNTLLVAIPHESLHADHARSLLFFIATQLGVSLGK